MSDLAFKANQKCPICDIVPARVVGRANDFEYLSSDKEYKFRECPSCKTLVIDPIPNLDAVAELIYPEHYYSFSQRRMFEEYKNSFWGKRFHLEVLDGIQSKFKRALGHGYRAEDLKVLDYGAGDGFYASLLPEVGFSKASVYVYDYNLDPLQDLRKQGFSIWDPEMGSVKFDLILMNHVMEHMPDPVKTLEKLIAHLAPNGKIVIEMPAPTGFHFWVSKRGHWGGYHAPRHLFLYSAAGFRGLAAKAHFVMLNSEIYLNDTWIWAQTLQSIIETTWIGNLVPRCLRQPFSTGTKEVPTLMRAAAFSGLSSMSKIIKFAGLKSSVAEYVICPSVI